MLKICIENIKLNNNYIFVKQQNLIKDQTEKKIFYSG